MIVRAGSGWQTTLADLALILFIASASAGLPAELPAAAAPSADARAPVALALWRDGGGVRLADWLKAQEPDPRATLQLTIDYRPASRDQAWALARELELAARLAAPRLRTVLRPAAADRVEAALIYD